MLTKDIDMLGKNAITLRRETREYFYTIMLSRRHMVIPSNPQFILKEKLRVM